MKRSDFPLWARVQVRWGDMDAMGHVNNAMYFTYLETARIELFASLGLEGPMTDGKIGMSLAHAACNFRREVKYPNVLEIGTVVTKVGTSSFQLAHVFLFDGTDTLAADGNSVVVWADYARGKSVPLPDAVRMKLMAFTATPQTLA